MQAQPLTPKRDRLLGMRFSSARARLERSLLFKLAVECGYKCYRCGGELTKETFSVEHKQPWMRSSDPAGSFFDLENISFSHMRCNLEDMISRIRKYPNRREQARTAKRKRWESMTPEQRTEFRRNQYIKYEKGRPRTDEQRARHRANVRRLREQNRIRSVPE